MRLNHPLHRVSAAALALLLCLSLAACAGQRPAPSSSAAPAPASSGPAPAESSPAPSPASSEAEPAPEAAFPVKVTDHLGREVEIPAAPERIVSGYYITSSLLIALGLEDKAVGIEAKADTRPIYALAAPEMLELPSVGTAKEFDLEGCIALKPDLVILPVKLKDSAAALESAGVTVLAVNPEDMDLLKETVTMVGRATGTADRAGRLLQYYDDKLAEIQAVVAPRSFSPAVYLAGNSDPLSTATAKMYQNDLIVTAGGRNVAGDIDDTYWATISYEQLIAYNPDLIVIAPAASYTRESLLDDPKLASLEAVKNSAVYQMPGSFEAWDSPVPSGILGALWLTSVLTGGQYPFETFQAEAAAFYKEFYGMDIDPGALTK